MEDKFEKLIEEACKELANKEYEDSKDIKKEGAF